MTGYSFNRVRTAALKSIAAMQDRLENIACDFGDVDMFLAGEAEQCAARLQEFGESAKTTRSAVNGSPVRGRLPLPPSISIMDGYFPKRLNASPMKSQS